MKPNHEAILDHTPGLWVGNPYKPSFGQGNAVVDARQINQALTYLKRHYRVYHTEATYQQSLTGGILIAFVLKSCHCPTDGTYAIPFHTLNCPCSYH